MDVFALYQILFSLCVFFFFQNILGEFSKEQDAFIRGQQNAADGIAPWIGHQNEEKVKEEILGLSQVSTTHYLISMVYLRRWKVAFRIVFDKFHRTKGCRPTNKIPTLGHIQQILTHTGQTGNRIFICFL